jgi:hypothetical protein
VGLARESGRQSVMKAWCVDHVNEAGRGFDETAMVHWGRESGMDCSATRRRRCVGRRRRTMALGREIDGGATVFGGRG